MSATYLHGIETVQGSNGVLPIATVKTAVIGLVGIAPSGPVNTLTIVRNRADAAQFGSPLPGFDIPKALSIILAFGGGPVLVVNTFDSTTNTTQVTAESHTIASAKTALSFAPIGAVTVLDSAGAAVAFVAGTDYSIDAYGKFTVLSSAIADGTVLKFTYKKLNGASVTSSQIIGTYNTGTGVRTGMQCWDLAKNNVGFLPKILIAPNYSSVNAVAAELIAKATVLRAVTYLDAPSGTTTAGAITGRGLAGTINFNTSSKHAELLFPYVKSYDAATDTNTDFPMAPFLAGLRSKVDIEEGYHVSTSNHELIGALGMAVNISAGVNDPNTDANGLNAAGITTLFNTFGTGIRAWGNRNGSFPVNTAPDSFVTDVRTAGIVFESIEDALLNYLDKPITRVLIDVILESTNQFIRTLIGRGALVPGSRVEFPAEYNGPTELAAGQLTFELIRMVTPPFERGVIRDTIDINLLKNLL